MFKKLFVVLSLATFAFPAFADDSFKRDVTDKLSNLLGKKVTGNSKYWSFKIENGTCDEYHLVEKLNRDARYALNHGVINAKSKEAYTRAMNNVANADKGLKLIRAEAKKIGCK